MIPSEKLVEFTPEAINSQAVTLTVLGYAICFIALILLFYAFSAIPKIIRLNRVLHMKRKGKIMSEKETDVPADVSAAIALALYLKFQDFHDPESDIITIRRISKTYSPWSSKIWSVRNIFNRP